MVPYTLHLIIWGVLVISYSNLLIFGSRKLSENRKKLVAKLF
jgi:hypothetical protein